MMHNKMKKELIYCPYQAGEEENVVGTEWENALKPSDLAIYSCCQTFKFSQALLLSISIALVNLIEL